MIYVESDKEYEKMCSDLAGTPHALIIPFYSDIYKHYARNRISFIYIYNHENDEEYIIGYNNNDLIQVSYGLTDFLKLPDNLYVLNLKGFLYFYQREQMYDLDLFEYFQTNKHLDTNSTDTKAHDFLYRQMHKYPNANDVVPITKHYEKCVEIRDKFKNLNIRRSEAIENYNKYLIGGLQHIEREGMFVDYLKFLEKFGRNGLEKNLTFSEYNIYTTTGRPSNRHAGINYGALNKDDGTRESFVSRFGKNGFLLSFDYDAYHLRLIASLIGYTFPANVNIHEYLGKQYFNTNTLTEQQYNESKTISFRQLYGGVQPEYEHIPYFQATKKFIENLWKLFRQQGYVETPIFGREMRNRFFVDINKNKLFNYLLQNMETERNMLMINDLVTYLKDKKTKMILYTYDSLLFDYSIEDGKQTIIDIENIMENGGYPVTLSVGADYHTMKEMELPQ
jgi:hypothetical protein